MALHAASPLRWTCGLGPVGVDRLSASATCVTHGWCYVARIDHGTRGTYYWFTLVCIVRLHSALVLDAIFAAMHSTASGPSRGLIMRQCAGSSWRKSHPSPRPTSQQVTTMPAKQHKALAESTKHVLNQAKHGLYDAEQVRKQQRPVKCNPLIGCNNCSPSDTVPSISPSPQSQE